MSDGREFHRNGGCTKNEYVSETVDSRLVT